MISSKLIIVLLFYGLLNDRINWIQAQAAVQEPCVFKESDLSATCRPCKKDEWLEMVKPSAGGDEKITNAAKTCFNDDPIITYHGINDPTSDGSTVIATGEYKVGTNHGPRGFVLRKQPFFRYAYIDPPHIPPRPNAQKDPYLDLNNVKKYYVRPDSNGKLMDADFQMVEWPGATAAKINEQLNPTSTPHPSSCDKSKGDLECKHSKKWMLEFERDNGKIQHYACNAEDGTNIVVVASIGMPKNSSLLDKMVESSQKIWLAHGNKSILDNYIQPLYAPQNVLEKMVTEGSVNCTKQADFMGLRTVLDFTFTKNRLILGMECGIIIVKNLASNELTFAVASLRSDVGLGPDLFTERINKVSASTCCLSDVLCGKEGGLVAAYSFSELRKTDDDKFIYISFDYGDTFEKKIIATSHSPINLIKGLYKLYGQWHDYYEILHNPDEDDLKDDDRSETEDESGTRIKLKKLRSKPVWETSLTEGREKLFSIGTPHGKKKATLEKIVEILEHRVPRRRKRREMKGEKDPDMTPEWVNNILYETRKKFDWEDSWTDENCDTYPECKKKFENDRAVDWLLKDANISIKTPKRNENEPFCMEITSMLVLPEERHIMALCKVGYEKLDASGGASSRQSPASPPPSPGSSPSSPGSSPPSPGSSPLSPGSSPLSPGSSPLSPGSSPPSPGSSPPSPGSSPPSPGSSPPSPGSSPPSPASPQPPPAPEFGYYALYNFPIKVNLPLIYGYRVSQRIFACKYIRNPIKNITVQPEIVRILNTATIFVINCDGVIYLSTNFGNTLFNTAFYYEQETIEKHCKQDSNYVAPSATDGVCEDEMDRPTNISLHYLRTFRLCALNVPPIFATDSSGYLFLMTFGKFYAHGAIAYNRETRLVVGEALHEMDYDNRFQNLLFPSVDRNGETILTISLTQAYGISVGGIFESQLYKNKSGLRMVQMPLPYNRDARNFDNGNLAMCKQALQNKYGFPVCKTSSYGIYPKRLDMDIGEKQYVQVEARDGDPSLPLWIFSSNEDSVEVKAFVSLREGSPIPNVNVHNWKLEISAKPNNKSGHEGESFVDAFFGSDYNKLNEYSTQISFVNSPNARCHVRPSSTVNVQIGCKGKKLVAYEDKYRPQCKYFRNNFNYTLPKGRYDPDLANLWMATSSNQSRSFYRINSEGDLIVTYDYVTWGCPVEPFAADHFIPDLRIVEEISENDTTTITKFKGKFILIEVFGSKGFSYSKKVKDMKCMRAPQYLPEQTTLWKHRQRLFYLASERLKFPKTANDLENLNYSEDIKGNKILQNAEVRQHLNIWNRANYISCYDGDADSSVPKHVLDREYEIMKTRDDPKPDWFEGELDTEEFEEEKEKSDDSDDNALNEIVWNKDHPRVFLFLAVAVDEYDSLCDYQALFGVSLKTIPDMNDMHSFIIFLLFLLFWLFLVVGGYHVRKRYLRVTYMENAKADRLEQAAWSIIYRYEKLIHGNAMDALFHAAPENDADPSAAKMNLAARSVHDKRKAELRMKKTHIMAQEQARHERLQKLFQKQ